MWRSIENFRPKPQAVPLLWVGLGLLPVPRGFLANFSHGIKLTLCYIP